MDADLVESRLRQAAYMKARDAAAKAVDEVLFTEDKTARHLVMLRITEALLAWGDEIREECAKLAEWVPSHRWGAHTLQGSAPVPPTNCCAGTAGIAIAAEIRRVLESRASAPSNTP